MGQFNFEETNLICCYRKKTRAATVATMTAALPYMERPMFITFAVHTSLSQRTNAPGTIDYLTQENKGLRKQVNSEKSIQKQMEVLMLKKENEQLRRFVNSIPPEIRQALREQQRGQRHPKDYQR